ncbi:hypothetical protein BDR22DRAFT_272591 [Usnea florida]
MKTMALFLPFSSSDSAAGQIGSFLTLHEKSATWIWRLEHSFLVVHPGLAVAGTDRQELPPSMKRLGATFHSSLLTLYPNDPLPGQIMPPPEPIMLILHLVLTPLHIRDHTTIPHPVLTPLHIRDHTTILHPVLTPLHIRDHTTIPHPHLTSSPAPL